MRNNKNIILCILDGFSLEKIEGKINALDYARKPNIDKIFNNFPTIFLDASGNSVGLIEGQMGNSEVGHLTIGSGRISTQSLEIIRKKMINETIIPKEQLKLIREANSIHIIGLFSSGGVHSHEEHFYSLIKQIGLNNSVFLHLFTDGRDCGTKDSIHSVRKLEQVIEDDNLQNVKIATICGRYYGMDRDMKLEKTQLAFQNILKPLKFYKKASEGILDSYSNNITDEFIEPFGIQNIEYSIKENDAVLFVNFRTDRMRQICSAFFNSNSEFYRKEFLQLKKFTMTNYFADLDESWQKDINVIIQQDTLKNTLSEVIANESLSQVKITETEKYPHLTFFLNGLIEKPFRKERRIMINSPKVQTYDLMPEMSIKQVWQNVEKEIINKTNVIFINIPNCDMVGHTGNLEATASAIEHVDKFLEKLVDLGLQEKYIIILTSDHGNIENMGTELAIHTAHTTSKIPFCIISNDKFNLKKEKGGLSNIAPTILDIMNIKKPKEMTANSLLIK